MNRSKPQTQNIIWTASPVLQYNEFESVILYYCYALPKEKLAKEKQDLQQMQSHRGLALFS